MARIVFDQVDMVYPGGVKGVDGLSLEIRDGEFIVFVCPSGCGKTTALRSIASLSAVAAGADEEGIMPITGHQAMWTARVASRSEIRPGQQAELAVDTSNMQFFDPDTGLSIGHAALVTSTA